MADSASVPAESPAVETVKAKGFLKRTTFAIDNVLRLSFFRLGYFVARNPWKVIALSTFFALLGTAGMLRFTTEERGERLWVPQGSTAQDNKDVADAAFGNYRRFGQIVFVGKGEGEDIGTKQGVLDMITVIEEGNAIEGEPVTSKRGDGTPTTYDERCVRSADSLGNSYCLTFSPLDLFYDSANVDNSTGSPDFLGSVRSTVESLSDAEVRDRLVGTDEVRSFSGAPLAREDFIAVKDGKVTGMLYSFLLENNLVTVNGIDVDEEADSWEEAWSTGLLAKKGNIDANTVDWFVDSLFGQEDALSSALTGDLGLFSIGIVLLVVYVVLFLGEFHTIQSRMNLGLAAILTSGLAIGFTFGFSSLVGWFYGPVHNILSLLLIGVGVDDIMVITKALNEVNRTNERFKNADVPTRVGLAISQAGAAITVTSITNLLVFLASAVSRLPALRFFSLWAAVGVFADYVLSVTFFVGCLALDQRRIDAKRRDCCLCFKPVEEPQEKNWFKLEFGVFNRFFSNRLGPFLLRPVVRVVMLAVFAAMLAVCSWGASRLYLKFEFSFFYPSGSDQREFQDTLDGQFQQPQPSFVYVTRQNVETTENQQALLDLCKVRSGVIAQSEWVDDGSVNCWYEQFRGNQGVADGDFIEPTEFLSSLREFLAGPGKSYEDSIQFADDGAINISRIGFNYKYADSNDEEIDRLESLREDVAGSALGADAFPYGFNDIFVEQFIALPKEIAVSLALAVAAVGVVTFLLIGSPIVGAICMLIVGIVLIDVIGCMNFTGYNLNSVSVIALSVSVGFACDNVVHVARSFLEHVGTRRERALAALGELGPPVFHAAFSTFIAIFVLVFAKSYIFKSLFWGFFTLLILAMVHGLILSPIVLSLIGSEGFYATVEEKERHELELQEKAVGQLSKPEEAETGRSTTA